MLNPKQLEFLAAASRAAVRSERLYGVPAELTLAQPILESGWGAKMPGCNCFGIKASKHHPQCSIVTTQEVLTPAQYAAWKTAHPNRQSRVLETLPDGKVRIQLDDAFAAFGCL